MNKIENYVIILLLWGIVASCNTPISKKNDSSLYVDLTEKQEVSLYDIFSGVEIIPLETADSIVMGEPVMAMRVHNGEYYFTCLKQESIWHFGQNGALRQEINHYGSGPGEYSDISDFRFNRFTDDLEVLSARGYLNIYNEQGSLFKKRLSFINENIKSVHYYIELSPSAYILFSDAKDGNKMMWYDTKEGKVIAENYDLPEYLFFNTPYHHSFTPFYCFRDTIHFVQAYNGDVFTVGNRGELTPKYHFDFGEYNFDIANLKEESIQYYVVHSRTTGAKYANRFIIYGENSNYYITRFKFQNRLCHLFLDKRDGKLYLFNRFKENSLCFPLYVDEEYAYFVVTPQELSMAINKDVLSEEDQRKYEKISPYDNPIVIKYRFK